VTLVRVLCEPSETGDSMKTKRTLLRALIVTSLAVGATVFGAASAQAARMPIAETCPVCVAR